MSLRKVISLILFAVYLSFTAGTIVTFLSSQDYFLGREDGVAEEHAGKTAADIHLGILNAHHLAKHVASSSKLKLASFNSLGSYFISHTNSCRSLCYFKNVDSLFYKSSLYLRNRALLI
jgi:hypothetical protein